jgi:hypothetical protein
VIVKCDRNLYAMDLAQEQTVKLIRALANLGQKERNSERLHECFVTDPFLKTMPREFTETGLLAYSFSISS